LWGGFRVTCGSGNVWALRCDLCVSTYCGNLAFLDTENWPVVFKNIARRGFLAVWPNGKTIFGPNKESFGTSGPMTHRTEITLWKCFPAMFQVRTRVRSEANDIQLIKHFCSRDKTACFKVTAKTYNVTTPIPEPGRGKTARNSQRSTASSTVPLTESRLVRSVNPLRGLETCNLLTAAYNFH
jgi:hypothetical protein